MIDWNTILYGAALSAVAAAVLLALAVRGRRPAVIALGTAAAVIGPVAWNAILRATNGTQFFVDAPIAAFPVSWQDTGSGVFTLAAAVLTYGLLPAEPSRRVAAYALLAALAALVVDVYLY
ncbi:hypothetical protein ACWGE0_00065 [Lentzea sp. NPDC054927]